MKTIKINFICCYDTFKKDDNIIYNLLKENFNVELSDKPDFLFVFPFDGAKDRFDFLDYDCVRISYTGEPYTPDFGLFDYAIGFDNISFEDKNGKNRYYRLTGSISRLLSISNEELEILKYGLDYQSAKNVLKQKKKFCSFVYGHKSAKGEREELFNLLCSYKQVDSAGTFMNNMSDGFIADFYRKEQKQNLIKNYKFNIACESMTFPGFVTEKIVDAFLANTIPIYYGDPFVDRMFNEKSFINSAKLSKDDLLERIKELDSNEEEYLKILMQPKFIRPTIFDEYINGLKDFLYYICSQDKEDAYRRQRFYSAKLFEDKIKEYRTMGLKNKDKTKKRFLIKIIKRILKSFIVRNQNFLNNCRLKKGAKLIKKYHNKYYGKRCFIVGNGPSLSIDDLKKIKNEITFATHRIYLINDKYNFVPNFYCAQDQELILKDFLNINKIRTKKFIAVLNKGVIGKIKNAIFLQMICKNFYPSLPDFSTNLDKGIYEGYTVTYMCLQIAIYMGFKEIVLIGVDHNYSIELDKNGNILTNKNVKDHFAEEDKITNIPCTYKSTLAYHAAKKFADEHNIRIINASRGGKLDVFERKNLEDILGE